MNRRLVYMFASLIVGGIGNCFSLIGPRLALHLVALAFAVIAIWDLANEVRRR